MVSMNRGPGGNNLSQQNGKGDCSTKVPADDAERGGGQHLWQKREVGRHTLYTLFAGQLLTANAQEARKSRLSLP